MKTFAFVLLLGAVVMAEPPQYRQARFRSQRQEVEGQGVDAPYAPAGYRPAKAFNLPTHQEYSPPATNYGIPADSYGAPFNTYSTPQSQYGVPQETDNNNKYDREEVENVNEANDEQQKENIKEEPKNDAEVISAQGAYYVLLPGSQLQRVQFQTENDVRNMAYTAKLQYKNEDRAPIFVYTAVPQYQSAAYIQLL
ncbi:uncharacterized protein LOC123658459 [Melitaea cinxia]|uniref:uncharacterized protein LOC123658459 n=1 Tax=Melitaea cinxia TaxID=113334 RepID=UPI001E271D2F|nr:uncharacterized protein LOC123658459 [Melitaea cinxia]